MTRPLRILTWPIHGKYLYNLAHTPHEFYLPVKQGQSEGYGGRLSGFSWPDNVFDVPQTIVVAKGNLAALAVVNRMIDETRSSGFLKAAMDQSGIVGIDVAPSGYGYGRAE